MGYRIREIKNLGISKESLSEQVEKLRPVLPYLYLPTLLTLIFFAVVGAFRGIPMTDFEREPQMVTHTPYYVGMLSTLGCFLWAAAAGLCFFGWAMLRRVYSEVLDKAFPAFFLFWGFLTVHLCLDDMFLFHESVYPFYLGIREELNYCTYFVVTFIGLIAFRRIIAKTDYSFLVIAGVFFALKIALDQFCDHGAKVLGHALWQTWDPEVVFGQWRILVEDGLKMFGIVTWLAYFWRCCFTAIQTAYTNAAPEPAIAADGSAAYDASAVA